MSTGSSVPEPGPRTGLFRWKAIGPLLLVLALLAVLVVIFAEPVARDTLEEAATELLGTQVDVAALNIDPDAVRVDLAGLAVADPFDSTRNLLQAEAIAVRLNPEALAEKKIVIERMVLTGMRFGVARERPARRVRSDGYAARLLGQVHEWSRQFDVPLLSLTPIDTIRQIALDPGTLSTVQQARALAARADSTRRGVEAGFAALRLRETVDTARALADRLAATDPRRLGVDGTRRAVQEIRSTLAELESVRGRLDRLEGEVEDAAAGLAAGVVAVDSARRRDYAFARSLLRLPSFEAPEIGKALFGRVSIDRFQQALYYAGLAQKYMPPGLRPRESAGPGRLRAAGTTVRFPREREWPGFLLEDGRIDFALDGTGDLRGSYEAAVQGITTAPAIYGRPVRFTARRVAAGSALPDVRVGGVIDHRDGIRDSADAVVSDVALPAFALPGTPFRVDPRRGTTRLSVRYTGQEMHARWRVSSRQVAWAADTAGRRLNELERVVWRVLSGLDRLEVTAELSGPVRTPRLAVRSNLDQAVADRIRAVLGEELARAERRARAEVDRLVRDQADQARSRAEAVRAEAGARLADERARLDQARERLEAELARLAAPVRDRIPLPGLKLPS